MMKRKALDSGCQLEHKKHMIEKEKHTENIVDAMQVDMGSDIEADMKTETFVITSNTNTDDVGKDLCTSLQPTDIAVTVKKEDILSACAHSEKKHVVATITDSCSSTEMKTTSSQQTEYADCIGETKSTNISLNEDRPNYSLQDVQGHFPASVLSLPSSQEGDMLSKSNSDETFNDIPKPPVNKEDDCLSKAADNSDETFNDILKQTADAVILKQISGTPDTYLNCRDATTNSMQHKSYSRRVKKISSDTDSVTHPSLPVAQGCISGNTSSLSNFAEKEPLKKIADGTSEANNFISSLDKDIDALNCGVCADYDGSGMTDLTGNAKFGAAAGNMALSLDTEDNGTMKSTDAISNTVCTISSLVASNLHQVGYPSIPTVVAEEKEPDEGCDIELVHKDSSDDMLQVMKGNIAGNSEKGSREEVQKSRDKEVKHSIHELDGSKDALALLNEELADESCMMPEASGTSAEGNLKTLSSPIRGVIHDFASLAEPNEQNPLGSSKKEEVSFSFQTTKKFLSDESSDNHSEKACSGVEANDLLPIISKDDDLSSTISHNVSGITNGVENEVNSLSMSHTAENSFTSDPINSQDTKSEDVVLEPARNLVSRTRKKLLVLDLNGLLADIILDKRNVYKATKKVGGKSVFKRPFCDDFLKFCFETFDIGVWSSRRKYNVDSVLDFIMGDCRHKLLFCWDQSHCTYTGFGTQDNMHKPLVLKELKKLWLKEESDLPWEKGDYSASNTLLVDDSPYKALCNPPNTGIFPHPYRFDDENDASLGPGGDLRVYLEGLAVADDVQLYVQEHPFGQRAITKNDSSWDFYLQIIEKVEQPVPTTQ